MMLNAWRRPHLGTAWHSRRGLGQMTTEQARQLLATGAGTPDQLAEANRVYYASYAQAPSVVAAAAQAPGQPSLPAGSPYPAISEAALSQSGAQLASALGGSYALISSAGGPFVVAPTEVIQFPGGGQIDVARVRQIADDVASGRTSPEEARLTLAMTLSQAGANPAAAGSVITGASDPARYATTGVAPPQAGGGAGQPYVSPAPTPTSTKSNGGALTTTATGDTTISQRLLQQLADQPKQLATTISEKTGISATWLLIIAGGIAVYLIWGRGKR